MNKLASIISHLTEEELLKIRKDLVVGNIDKLITKKLESFHHVNYSEKICPVCGGEINEDSFKLEFGKSYLKKRAYFDGTDCLEYFLATQIKKK